MHEAFAQVHTAQLEGVPMLAVGSFHVESPSRAIVEIKTGGTLQG